MVKKKTQKRTLNIQVTNRHVLTRDAIRNQTGQWSKIVLFHSSPARNNNRSSTITHTLIIQGYRFVTNYTVFKTTGDMYS